VTLIEDWIRLRRAISAAAAAARHATDNSAPPCGSARGDTRGRAPGSCRVRAIRQIIGRHHTTCSIPRPALTQAPASIEPPGYPLNVFQRYSFLAVQD
jgi:hypothetical protein